MLAWILEGSVLVCISPLIFLVVAVVAVKHFVTSVTLLAEISFSPKFSTGILT